MQGTIFPCGGKSGLIRHLGMDLHPHNSPAMTEHCKECAAGHPVKTGNGYTTLHACCTKSKAFKPQNRGNFTPHSLTAAIHCLRVHRSGLPMSLP